MAHGQDPKEPASGKNAAKSTVSGPRRGPREANDDGAAARLRKTQALAAAFPFNRNKADEIGDGARAPKPGATAEPADASVTASTLTERNESAEDRRAPRSRPQPRERAPRPGARRLRRPRAHDELRPARSPTTRTRSRPACAVPPCWRTSSSGRRSRTSTTSASPSGSSTPAARPRTASSSATSRSRSTRAPRSCRRRASAPRSSCASRPSRASAGPSTRRATCAASRPSSTPTRGTSTSSGTTSRSSSSRTR